VESSALVMRRAREAVRHLARVLEAAVDLHPLADPADVGFPPLPPRLTEEGGEPRALVGARAPEEGYQHEGPLALPDVAVALLPVAARIAGEVQEVVLDLEGRAEKEAEADEAVEVAVAARADQRTDPARVDGRVPARLLEDHLEVVGVRERYCIVAPPPELERLPLDRLARHALGLLEDAHREAGPERPAVVDESPQTEERERIADVHRHRDAVESVERRAAASLVALVLDVVVHEKGIVEELEGNRGAQPFLRARAKGACGGDAEGRPQHASAAARVVGDGRVERTLRGPRAEVVAEGDAREVAVLAQESRDGIGRCRERHRDRR